MLAISIYNRVQHFQRQFDSGAIVIGRQPDEHSQTISINDHHVSSNQCLIRYSKDKPQEVQLTNLGRSLVLKKSPRLHRGKSLQIELPFSMCIGDTHVHLFHSHIDQEFDHAIRELNTSDSNLPLGQFLAEELGKESSAVAEPQSGPEVETLAAWFEALAVLNRKIPGSHEFFESAARSLFNPGGFDAGLLLRQGTSGWEILASHVPFPDCGAGYRIDLIERAIESRATIYHCSSQIEQKTTTPELHSAIVSPIFDSERNTIAVIYGSRSQHVNNHRRGVRVLEAQFVRLIAEALSTGLMRMESEADAARAQVLLEQAFSPKVAQEMRTNPDILEGKDREVSVVFCDLRGFSTISERIGARKTYKLLTDVMDRFSQIIQLHDGVIIDFYGDGLSAFWNAPLDQPQHASLAVRAATEIAQVMPELNKLWMAQLGKELQVGVGVHTGTAQVGNSGSSSRLKYGPQGNTVNIAARLETATSHIGSSILISDATAQKVGDEFPYRRVCSMLLKGIKVPITVHEVYDPQSEHFEESLLEEYGEALTIFEQGQIEEAIALFMKIQIETPLDRVTEFMLNAAVRKSRTGSTDINSLENFEPLTSDDVKRLLYNGRQAAKTTMTPLDPMPSQNSESTI